MENRQNYMMDNNSMQRMNVASAGDGVVGGVQAEVVSGVAGEILGGKYDEHHEEHDVTDDDELKYVAEVQQSEKQQQQQLQTLKNYGLDDDGTYENNELAEKETANNVGYGNGGFEFGGDHQIYHHHQQQQHDLFDLGNGHDTNGHNDNVNINENISNLVSIGLEEKHNILESELDILKNEGGLSLVGEFVPEIDVKIEEKAEQLEIGDEEEPSSLATNTTNGTSSLSENVPPQLETAPQANSFDDFMSNLEDKENTDPLTPQRPNELDLEHGQSLLNPDAKEFVPSFGSNPSSPTSPFPTGVSQNEPELSDIMETKMYFGQAPTAVPQHLFGEDDFVAQSPRKGKGDNMDSVALPNELSEFEQEADKRPHEPEGIEYQSDEVMTPDQAIQQLPLDDFVALEKEDQLPTTDSTDFQPSDFIDHGPETCVDLDTDLDMEPLPAVSSLQGEDDVMKRSIYVASNDEIEDVLNSVQPIPNEIDSVNNSFMEESATESAAAQMPGDKELLQVEEKEHVSHSPSTEEIQMNLQNTLNSSNKDIPQLPNDMDDAINMQDSLYIDQEPDDKPNEDQSKYYEDEKRFEPEEQIIEDQLQEHNVDELHDEIIQQVDQKDIQPHEQLPSTYEQIHYQEEIQDFRAECENKETEFEELHFQQDEQVHEKQQFPEESSTEFEVPHQDHDQQMVENVMNDTISTEVAEESLLTDTTNPLVANDSFVSDDFKESQQQDEEFNKLYSVIMNEASTHEKHLLEETKEQQLFSMSGLEQQMSEMVLNNTDADLSQATTATSAIKDPHENLIVADEAFAEEVKYHEQPEVEEIKEQMFVNDLNHQRDIELNEADIVHEAIESPIEQEHEQQLQSEMVVADEPTVETRESVPFFTNEETELVNITKTEERQELVTCMVPETAPAELLEQPMTIQSETESVEVVNDTTEKETPVEIQTEAVKETEIEELETKKQLDTTKEELVAPSDTKADVPVEAAIIAATAAVATAAVAAATSVEASSGPTGKSETAKKPLAKATTATAKPKAATAPVAKKAAEPAKKPIGLAAKPRTAPAKPAAAASDKKPISKTTATTARKPLSSTTTAAPKPVAKTTTLTATTRTLTTALKTTTTSKPTTAPRTVSSSTTTARKPVTTNGPLAKPRPATAPAKPTTLGLSATNGAPKTKPTSPRATTTTQVRKTIPATAGAKSPVKATATNGVSKTASSSLASRTKTTTSTVSNTVGTASKTFTARPAPKFTSSSTTSTSTTTTTRRSTIGVSATTTATKTSTAPLRKSSPTKSAVAGKTPTKPTTTAGSLKAKTPISKPAASPSAKPAPIRKPVNHTLVVTNGEANDNKALNGTAEKITTLAEEQLQQTFTGNGDMLAVQLEQQRNGDSSIPTQTENQHPTFLESRDEPIPMDLINA